MHQSGAGEHDVFFVDFDCSCKYTSGHPMVAAARLFRQDPNCAVAEEQGLPDFKAWIRGAIARSKA